jgi:hypothetical protein
MPALQLNGSFQSVTGQSLERSFPTLSSPPHSNARRELTANLDLHLKKIVLKGLIALKVAPFLLYARKVL